MENLPGRDCAAKSTGPRDGRVGGCCEGEGPEMPDALAWQIPTDTMYDLKNGAGNLRHSLERKHS